MCSTDLHQYLSSKQSSKWPRLPLYTARATDCTHSYSRRLSNARTLPAVKKLKRWSSAGPSLMHWSTVFGLLIDGLLFFWSTVFGRSSRPSSRSASALFPFHLHLFCIIFCINFLYYFISICFIFFDGRLFHFHIGEPGFDQLIQSLRLSRRILDPLIRLVVGALFSVKFLKLDDLTIV